MMRRGPGQWHAVERCGQGAAGTDSCTYCIPAISSSIHPARLEVIIDRWNRLQIQITSAARVLAILRVHQPSSNNN